MTAGVQTVIFPVKDVEKAKAIFTALLGEEPYVDQPYYVGYRVAGQDIGLDPNGHQDGVTAYFGVDDIEKSVAALTAAGAQVSEEPHDVGGGKLIARLTDAEGSAIGLSQG